MPLASPLSSASSPSPRWFVLRCASL
uniref:Uncharacterized protein n=1 Tax=Arundo donax TaxID=35708 RepID=A0A0A9EG81_ARUDO